MRSTPSHLQPPTSLPLLSSPARHGRAAAAPAADPRVIGPQYCIPYPINLGMVKKLITIIEGNFAVSDCAGNKIFKVKHVFHKIQRSKITAHSRWLVFRGESTEPDDLVFSARTSSMFQLRTQLHVFLAANKSQSARDYWVEGSWTDRSCSIYVGDSKYKIAQMHKKHTIQSMAIGRDTYTVTVYPNIDHAFTVVLVTILNEINRDKKDGE
ncbi:hypothetical protein BT93_A0546 [Corymbia citriodora subsp. variegata]|nr:hypothetical protein BT93_A0546 [Corymbia citriodora subsp. variegata]